MHPDQVLLTFAGIFLYFQKHSKPDVAAGMTARIEKHWKALDQPMFVLALVLNPFEGVSHFGNKASVGSFTLNTILMEVWSIYSQHYSVIYCLITVFTLDLQKLVVQKKRIKYKMYYR